MERTSRLAATAFVLLGGLVHLQLWRSGYRGIPYVGPSFLANVGVSSVLAVAVFALHDRRVDLAGIVFSVASLGALVMSRTVGLFGFTERAWTLQAQRASAAEIGAVVALLAVLAATRLRPPVPASVLVPVAAPGGDSLRRDA